MSSDETSNRGVMETIQEFKEHYEGILLDTIFLSQMQQPYDEDALAEAAENYYLIQLVTEQNINYADAIKILETPHNATVTYQNGTINIIMEFLEE